MTPDQLRAQHAQFGPIWWTAERERAWTPLDDERLALRLSAPEAERLASFVPVFEASRELELDAVARMNRARPPVASLAPTDEERAASLAVIELHAQADEASASGP